MSKYCQECVGASWHKWYKKVFLKPETAVGKNGASGRSKKSPVKKSCEMAHLRQDTTRQKTSR